MEPLSKRAIAPDDGRVLAGVKTWTAWLSTSSRKSVQELRDLLPTMLHAIRGVVVLTVLCGVVFPLVVYAIGQFAFSTQANGSFITNDQGQVLGSSLIGQQFTESVYFHGRPSAVAYNAASSGGSNIGPTNPQLLSGNGTVVTLPENATPPPGSTPVPGKPNTYYVPGSYLGVSTYANLFRAENGLAPNVPLPADIVTASGSGLDPDISVDAALLQVNRIVTARKALGGTNATVSASQVSGLIVKDTVQPIFGLLGEPRVNVLELNLALDKLFGPPPTQK